MGVFLGIMASLYLMGSQYGIKSATKVAYRGGYSTFLLKLVSMYRYLDTEILIYVLRRILIRYMFMGYNLTFDYISKLYFANH